MRMAHPTVSSLQPWLLLRFCFQSGADESEFCASSRNPGETCGLGAEDCSWRRLNQLFVSDVLEQTFCGILNQVQHGFESMAATVVGVGHVSFLAARRELHEHV